LDEPIRGEVMRTRGLRRPPPWIADLIAAAYNDDTARIKEADELLTEAERRELHRALRVLVGALVGHRLRSRAGKRMSLRVEPEPGTPGNPLRLGGSDASH
jgi:hypothetical protein